MNINSILFICIEASSAYCLVESFDSIVTLGLRNLSFICWCHFGVVIYHRVSSTVISCFNGCICSSRILAYSSHIIELLLCSIHCTLIHYASHALACSWREFVEFKIAEITRWHVCAWSWCLISLDKLWIIWSGWFEHMRCSSILEVT